MQGRFASRVASDDRGSRIALVKQAPTHLDFVDGLRAAAVLAVVVFHAMCSAPWAQPWLAAPGSLAPAWLFVELGSKGSHGVDLFFVISGFCLAYPSIARARRDGATSFDAAGFFAKRLWRIVPPYYAAIVVVTLAYAVCAYAGSAWTSFENPDLSPLSLLKQFAFLDRGTRFVNSSFWTLPVELRWYVAFPLLLALYFRSQRAFYATLAACVIAFNFTALRAIDIATLPGFMFGIVAADWYVNGHKLARFSGIALLGSLELALLLEPFASRPSASGLVDEFGFFVQTNVGWQLAGFFLVVSAGRIAWLRGALAFRPFRSAGLAAYSIYLIHQPIVTAWNVSGLSRLNPAENVAGAVACSFLGGGLFYFAFERIVLGSKMRTQALRILEPRTYQAMGFVGYPLRLTLGGVDIRTRQSIVPEAPPATVQAGAGTSAPTSSANCSS